MSKTPHLTLSAARTIALHAQQLAQPPDAAPTINTIQQTVEKIGCVQIDTLQMVNRSQYVALWSRLGCYEMADFDRLIYDPAQRRLFEYWQHAASIIPLQEYRYLLPKMRYYKNPADGGRWRKRRFERMGGIETVNKVLERIRQEGPLRGGDFEYDGPQRSGWWDWKPAKIALEYLYDCGDLMISDRVRFQRVYDLKERVLPSWVDTSEPTHEEVCRHRVEIGAKMLGVCQADHTADYTYMGRQMARPFIKALLDEGILHTVKAEVADGKTTALVVHRDNLPLLEKAADGALRAQHTTFLSPFDNLFWAQRRDMLFWNFYQTLEAYKPAPQRIWGYFSLPILHKERLVGRFDPKLERKTGTLRLKALHLEPGITPDEALSADVAAALRDFMAFHNAKTLVIEMSKPPEFAQMLEKAL